MTAPVISAEAIASIACYFKVSDAEARKVLVEAGLTAALAPEPTPLEAAAVALGQAFNATPAGRPWADVAKPCIDAWLKAGGAAKRRITRADALEVARIYRREHGGATDSMVTALAAIGIEVADE